MKYRLPTTFLMAFCALLLTAGATLAGHTGDLPIVFEDYPPYEFIEDGEVKGVNMDLIREAFRRMGMQPFFEPRPWKRALFELKSGEILALSSGFKTAERETFAYFPSEGLALEEVVVIGLTGRHLYVKSLADLTTLRVGVRAEYNYGKEFDKMEGLRKVTTKSNQQLLKLLLSGRVDVIIANKAVFTHLAKQQERYHEIRVLHRINSEPLYLFFSRARGEFARKMSEEFGKTIRQMKEDGTFAKIRNRY